MDGHAREQHSGADTIAGRWTWVLAHLCRRRADVPFHHVEAVFDLLKCGKIMVIWTNAEATTTDLP